MIIEIYDLHYYIRFMVLGANFNYHLFWRLVPLAKQTPKSISHQKKVKETKKITVKLITSNN